MSRKYPVVSKRKKDLNSKLRELKNEGDGVLKYVKKIIDEGIAVARDLEVETDNVIFIERYPAVIGKLNRLLYKLLRMNCNIELSVSEDEMEESIQNCVTEQSSLRSGYDLLIPESLIESSGGRSNPDIHQNSFSSESAPSSIPKMVPVHPVEEGDILDMCYVDGDTPYNFWLRYYKTKSLDCLNETMLTRYRNKQLHPYDTALRCTCRYVCAFDGEKCFRGEILSINFGQTVRFRMLDVDSGKIQTVEEVRVFRLDKDLSEIPVQALNCRLQGDLGDPLLWNDHVIPLFRQVLTESLLVVTVCGKVEHDGPLYLVEIDCHNDKRINSKIELNRWIILSVFPKLEEMKEKSEGGDILKSLYAYLDPVTDKEESSEQALQTTSSFLTGMSRASSQLPNLTLSCPASSIWNQNQPQNLVQGDPLSLKQMEESSPSKHVELTPHHKLKTQTTASTENLNLPINTKRTSLELNLKSPSETTFDKGERSNMNRLTASFFLCMSQSRCVSSDITAEHMSPLPEEKNISLHHSVLVSSVGQTYKAMLAHIEDPHEFYVHILCEDNIEIDRLQSKLNQYYNTVKVEFKSKKAAKYNIGSFCAAFYDADKNWYRAQIVDWNQDDSDLVSIKYVDYGNHSSVHFSVLQPLRAEFTELPICARQCHLAMIHPHTSTRNKISKSWPRSATDVFKKLVNMESLYSVVLMESNDVVCSLPVLLQDCQIDICINERMVELGYAVSFSSIDCSLYVAQRTEQEVFSASQDQNAQNLKDDSDSHQDFSKTKELIPVLDVPYRMFTDVMHDWDPMSEDYLSETNALHHDDEDACYAVTGYKPQDEKRICKFYAEKGRCFKGEICLKEHSYPHPDGWTTDKECMFTDAFSKLVLPDVRDEIVLQVTCITKVNTFYAVICGEGPGSSEKGQIRRIGVEDEEEEEEEETLATLNSYLNEERNVKALRRCAVTPAFGQIVVARFSMDGRFYRARVVDCSDGKLCVFYVDYGNREWVSESDVRDIEPKYLHLPFQAIDCVLANVDDVSESSEAKNFFARLVYNKRFRAQVIAQLHHLSRLEVLLWDENGYDVGACIIQSKYGKERSYSTHGLVAQGN